MAIARRTGTFAWMLLALLLAACNQTVSDGPATIPLTGRIQFSGSGSAKALADQSVAVQFESVDHPNTHAFGSILEDGTFTMATQTGETGKLGVVPGKHRVRLNADETAARLVNRRFLSYESSGITVEVPVQGEFTIKLSR